MILRLRFRDGEAGQVYTWRGGRLANVSVLPDWGDFVMRRTVRPVSDRRFEFFDQGSPLRLVVLFEGEGPVDRAALTVLGPDGRRVVVGRSGPIP